MSDMGPALGDTLVSLLNAYISTKLQGKQVINTGQESLATTATQAEAIINGAKSLEATVNACQKEISNLRERVTDLERGKEQNNGLKKTNAKLESRITDLDKENAVLKELIDRLDRSALALEGDTGCLEIADDNLEEENLELKEENQALHDIIDDLKKEISAQDELIATFKKEEADVARNENHCGLTKIGITKTIWALLERLSSNESYQFWETLAKNTSGANGVFALLTDCYSPTCTRDRLCYSISCPRRLEQQARLVKARPGLEREESRSSLHVGPGNKQKLNLTYRERVLSQFRRREKLALEGSQDGHPLEGKVRHDADEDRERALTRAITDKGTQHMVNFIKLLADLSQCLTNALDGVLDERYGPVGDEEVTSKLFDDLFDIQNCIPKIKKEAKVISERFEAHQQALKLITIAISRSPEDSWDSEEDFDDAAIDSWLMWIEHRVKEPNEDELHRKWNTMANRDQRTSA
ncbi:MAG: RHO1 GDP-GTP exchange protein 2 [Bathelium mastoideum]|nr:MAG: RHO1 GDP-GTP exchange protein 2 [Bathelium mastoideum]